MKQELERVVAQAVKTSFDLDVQVDLTRPDTQFGDFATNIALILSKQVGKNPREVAQALSTLLEADDRFISVDIAGPGFLNLRVSHKVLKAMMQEKPTTTLTGRTILVEYSDPNPFKPLHAGHLYTTLVGDSIARLVERAGAQTIRLNYGGDVGLHVARSMWAILRELDGENPGKLADISESARPQWLGARYVEGNTAYEADEQAKAEIIAINKRVYALHAENDHDTQFAQIYWTCREWSYQYFKTLYQQLQIQPFDRFIPESTVTQTGLDAVKEHIGTVFEESDGAVVYRGDEAKGLHTRVFINSEGLPTYETKDVGLSLTKWGDYSFDTSIIITDFSQGQYMGVVLDAIKQFNPEPAERTKHYTHGRVKLAGGEKISSRKGNGPSALEIIEAAREAGRSANAEYTEETILAAIKYAFAKVRIGGDIVYNPSESVALEGNSGPYIQYAHARARSILQKSTVIDVLEASEYLDDERTLALKLSEYSEVVERATAEYLPHHICTYLYELAQTFNRFYEHNRVIDDERESVRVQLVRHYAETLKDGLELLGIHAPDKM